MITVNPKIFATFVEKLNSGNEIDISEARQVVATAGRVVAPKADFNLCFDRLMGLDGDYISEPNGNEARWGLSKRHYPTLNIRNITREEAKIIYKKDFWIALNVEKLPAVVAFQLFDFAISSGIPTATRYLQRACGVADDGYWGPYSQEAADSLSVVDLIMRFNAECLDYLRRLEGWKDHGAAWAGRIANNLRYSAEDAT